MLLQTNTREVERYSADVTAIESTAARARETLIKLRETLVLVQQEKENKLHYDSIASDILSTRGLKPRDEQLVQLDRLRGEIRELERERDEYRQVWTARREQFGEIVKQLERMWAQIKEDKDEQDRREGMSEEEEGEEVEGKEESTPATQEGKSTPLHLPTESATPMVATPMPEVATPMPTTGGETPAQDRAIADDVQMDEEREEGEEQEEGEEREEGEETLDDDVDLVDAPPLRVHAPTTEKEGTDRETAEKPEQFAEKMDVST